MTTKTEVKREQEQAQPVGRSQEAMQIAYRTHTLAQMLYGQIAVTHPWCARTVPWTRGYPGPAMWGYPPGWGR